MDTKCAISSPIRRAIHTRAGIACMKIRDTKQGWEADGYAEMNVSCTMVVMPMNAISGANMIVRKKSLLKTELTTIRCLRWIVAILLITLDRSKRWARGRWAQCTGSEKENKNGKRGRGGQ
eukprot:817559-Pleurochrysis_carterae.AAC.1